MPVESKIAQNMMEEELELLNKEENSSILDFSKYFVKISFK